MAKTGRPPVEINQKAFENLCQLQCTLDEICSFLNVTDKTLNGWCRRTYGSTFSEVFKKKRVGGIVSLRRAQFELAKKNPAMAIFLGKNLLGQTDDPLLVETSPEALEVTPNGHWDKVDKYFRNAGNEDVGEKEGE